MAVDIDQVRRVLSAVILPDGRDIVAADLVRALSAEADMVKLVLEAEDVQAARALEPVRAETEKAVLAIAGVNKASVILTAHGPSTLPQKAPPPDLKIGRHATPQEAPKKIPGVDRVLVIASGKGGVGKSTVSSNLAVALARAGRRVGLLDADIYGPSQPRMMGTSEKPASPDGKSMVPVQVHGLKMISIGLMVDPAQALVWRGPMLQGTLQQLVGQVEWGALDVLIVDMPPGTGDVQLTLSQKTELTGALVVSTPQDVALLDARKAIDMFNKLKTPVLGLIENMSVYHCPQCGHEAHIFGQGGVRAEAEKIGVPFLGELPLSLDVRVAGDDGTPIAAGDGPQALAYARLAARLVADGIA